MIHDADGERIEIPARRNWFVLIFLCIWLTGWTAGGVGALYHLIQTGELLLAVWLVAWAAGWLFASATILWQLAGCEVIAVAHGNLSLQLRAGPLACTRCFRGQEIERLRLSPTFPFGQLMTGPLPLLGRSGVLKFDHGAGTVSFASGIDEAEAGMIRDFLLTRLPRNADPTG
ncbi:hypothetical protein DMC47_12040 [Nostoc sp. 3335mG]|nr:hypothetical protein DMC47_12040 [Nostoc sp. 3335mG]